MQPSQYSAREPVGCLKHFLLQHQLSLRHALPLPRQLPQVSSTITGTALPQLLEQQSPGLLHETPSSRLGSQDGERDGSDDDDGRRDGSDDERRDLEVASAGNTI